MAGNPWWSEPGWTLDWIPKDESSQAVGRHARNTDARPDPVATAPADARPEPQHRAEPDPAPSSPVRTPDGRKSLADLAARSKTPAWNVWVTARLASLRPAEQDPGEASPADLAAAWGRAIAARFAVDLENARTALGQHLGEGAPGTETADVLHRAAQDEDGDGPEAQDTQPIADEPHPFPHQQRDPHQPKGSTRHE